MPADPLEGTAGHRHRQVQILVGDPRLDLAGVTGVVNGRTDGRFLDHPRLFPVLATAAQLGVPLYLHPGMPSQVILDEYYSGLPPKAAFTLSTVGWGWHQETGLHALRMISAGIFDRLPGLHYPYSSNRDGPQFLDRLQISPADKEKISHLNAERLFSLPAA